MNHSATFARYFARLVWLLIHESSNIEEQKAALRVLVVESREGEYVLATRDWHLFANDEEMPDAMTGVQDAAAQMIGHALASIRVGAGSPAADLLGVARILAAEAMAGDGGDAASAKLAALGASTISFERVPRPEPEPAAAPFVTGSDMLMGGVVGVATPPMGVDSMDSVVSGGLSGLLSDDSSSGSMFHHFAAASAVKDSSDELLARLDRADSVDSATRTLDDLVTVAENAAREGKPLVVGDVFHGVVAREARVPEGDMKRAFVMAIRRLSKPILLRNVAMMLPRKRERLADYVAVLVRTGEDGADALIDQLTQAQTADDRRVYYDVLMQLNAGVPALLHMLGDARWFVARNAADLLGEMGAKEAEEPLIGLLHNSDDRVRRSATHALIGLGTPKAIQAIHDAIRDGAPEVRMQAAAAIASRREAASATTLIKALDDEPDGDVQLAMLAALGKLATPDAVRKLVAAAEPEGRLFKKKTAAFRVAAVQALGEAKTTQAISALRELATDREKDVRDTVQRLLSLVGR
ncbi:MAG: hypothetical protein JWO05_2452 [Gemmatimonadetes bacterium]|nr:hypothetical protein [Gemmatimonadota bacterium]